MLLNMSVALTASHFSAPPPVEVQNLVEDIRIPSGAAVAHSH
jgi:cation/acetate symporter